MNFKEALVYPFRRENLLSCVLIPGGMSLALVIVGIGLGLLVLGGGLLSGNFDKETLKAQADIVQLLISPVQFVTGVLLLGFIWHQIDNWLTNGFDSPAVSWTGNWVTLFVDGLKSWLFSVVVGILLALPLIALVIFAVIGAVAKSDLTIPISVGLGLLWLLALSFVGPFFQGALVQASESKSFAGLFNLERIIQTTLPCYWQVVWSYMLILGIVMVYIFGSIVISFTVIGIALVPFLWGGPFQISCWHLIIQAFDGSTEHQQLTESPSAIAENSSFQ